MRGRGPRRTGAGLFLLLWGVSALFGVGERTGGPPAITLHVLALLNDQYYMLFGVLPLVLFLCGSGMEDDPLPVVVRYGTFARYFFRRWRELGARMSVAWVGQLAALALSGWGLPLALPWPETTGTGLWREILLDLQRIFPGPGTALLCSALHVLAGYWFLALMALWLGHFCSRTGAVRVLMALYLYTFLLVKLPLSTRPPFLFLTGLHHLVVLLYNNTAPWRFPLTLAEVGVLGAGILVSVRWFWHGRSGVPAVKYGPGGLDGWYLRLLFSRPNALLAAGALALSSVGAWARSGGTPDGRTWALLLFAGHGTGTFWLRGLLGLLLAEVLPLWPLGILPSRGVRGMLCIRLRRRRDLLAALLRTTALWVLFCQGVQTLLAFLPVLGGAVTTDLSLLMTALGLRFLDLTLQALLFVLLLCAFRSPGWGFGGLVLGHCLAALPLPWWPVGGSSLERLRLPETAGGLSPAGAAAALLVCCAGALALLATWGLERMMNRMEV